jgi:hypothetical protein
LDESEAKVRREAAFSRLSREGCSDGIVDVAGGVTAGKRQGLGIGAEDSGELDVGAAGRHVWVLLFFSFGSAA